LLYGRTVKRINGAFNIDKRLLVSIDDASFRQVAIEPQAWSWDGRFYYQLSGDRLRTVSAESGTPVHVDRISGLGRPFYGNISMMADGSILLDPTPVTAPKMVQL